MKVNDLENKLHKMYIICQKIVKEKSDHYIKRVNDWEIMLLFLAKTI